MGRVIFSVMTTLDGFFEGPNRELDWHYADDEHNEFALRTFKSAGALVFGRVCYEMMAGYWPTASRVDPVTDLMNDTPKIVFSRTLKKVDWKGTTLLSGEVAEEVPRLKRELKGDLFIMGSARLAESFLKAGLLDEVQLMVCPLFLGRGKPLFPELRDPKRMELVKTKTRRSGVVELTYSIA